MRSYVTKKARVELDIEALKFWKTTSTQARLNFLDSALKFGKHFELKQKEKKT